MIEVVGEPEDQPVWKTALDVAFFVPLGLVVTVVEEAPDLAAKGRARWIRQWTTARVVGQFAVAQGRNELRKRSSEGALSPAQSPVSGPAPVSGPRTDPAGEAASADRAGNGARPAPAYGAGPVRPAGEAAGSSADSPEMTSWPVAGAAGLDSDDLAIPGYDSLSASQVVQRLAGLAPGELEAVRTYEAATRGRRTILARVSQLQGG